MRMNVKALVAMILAVPSSAFGASHDPAWGDDGELAFYSNPSGQFDIFVLDEKNVRRPLVESPAYDGSPQRRPLHEQWSFMSDRDGRHQLYLLNIGDKTVTRLVDRPGVITNHAWSSDGRWLVYENRHDGNADIWLFDTNSGVLRQLTDHVGADFDPDFSPDDRRIVFQSNRGGNYQLFTLGLERGSKPRALTDVQGHATGPEWSASGEIYYSHVTGEGSRLERINPETGLSDVVASFRRPALKPAVSPDGKSVALFRLDPADGSSEIMEVGLHDGSLRCRTCSADR